MSPRAPVPRTLVVFARAPELGRVKSRLAASIGDEAALALYLGFLEDTLAMAREAVLRVGAKLVLAVAGPIDHPALVALGVERLPQPDGDLGARMSAFLDGDGATCIIGSDAPTLTSAHLVRAFDALRTHEVVIGPGLDGGYWLVGATRPVPELMTGMPWSTARLLGATLDALAGRSAALLDFHYDVDDADDLALLRRHLAVLPPEAAPATRRALHQPLPGAVPQLAPLC